MFQDTITRLQTRPRVDKKGKDIRKKKKEKKKDLWTSSEPTESGLKPRAWNCSLEHGPKDPSNYMVIKLDISLHEGK